MTERKDFTASELLAVMAGRILKDGQIVFAGVGIPLLAATLAQRMHAPGLTILFEGGTIGPFVVPGHLPPSTNEQRCTRRANMLCGITEVLLLLHGMAGSSQTWRSVIKPLSRRFRVIAPDLPGHGESTKPRSDYSLGAFAVLLRDLLGELGVTRATIIGHSLGGGVAMQFAYQFPERTERLILVGSGGLGPEGSPAVRPITPFRCGPIRCLAPSPT